MHLFPVLRIIFNVRVQSTFVRRKSLLKKENKEKNYVDNNQCIFKDRGQLRLGSPAYGIDSLRWDLTDRASGSPADAQASAGTQVDDQNEEGGKGEISSFAALCTALSATIGTGNIVGVATAVCAGGPGALFWMIVAAFFGMATKFSEGLLAIKYRVVDKDGHSLGGPFYYIEQGMGSKWKWLAKIFAFFGVCVGLFGIGTFSQVNGIASAIQNFFDPNKVHTVAIPGIGTYSWTVVIASLILAFCVGAVLIGGIKRIASVSQIVVPFMAVAYFVFALILIICNITKVPAAVVTVVQGAFHPRAVTGGVVGSMFVAMQNGVARGIFSNEAGLGSAPIAAAAAQTHEPVRQGLVSMTGTFIDTIVICTLTGLSIVLTGAWQVDGLEGVQVTTYAFQNGLPFPHVVSSFVLMMCLVFLPLQRFLDGIITVRDVWNI